VSAYTGASEEEASEIDRWVVKHWGTAVWSIAASCGMSIPALEPKVLAAARALTESEYADLLTCPVPAVRMFAACNPPLPTLSP